MEDSPARGNAKSLKGVSEAHAEFEKRLFQWLLWADAGGLRVNGPMNDFHYITS